MKFKHNIEVQSGIADNNNLTGDSGQILSSTGSGVEWIDQNAITSASDFIFFNVKNETGSTILKGKGVMAVGTDGNSGHILVDEMVANGTVEPKYFLGVLEEDIPNGGFARVISFGQLDQFNTSGQNGETWNDGQILWCDPVNPGDFTITEPDGPNVKIAAAFILNSSTNGKIQVRVQANEGIHDLHDTKITSQIDGDVLVWDNTTGVWFNDSTLNVDYTNSRVGIGTTSPGVNLEIHGTVNTDDCKIYLKENDTYGSYFKYDGVLNRGYIGGITGTTSENSVMSWSRGGTDLSLVTSGSVALKIDSNRNVGIGTISPGEKLVVAGNIETETAAGKIGFNVGDSYGDYPHYGLGKSNSASPVNLAGYYGVTIGSAGIERMRITQGGNVGIGTTSPSEKLHVSGNARVTGAYYDSNNSPGTSGQVLSSTATGTDWVSLSEISGVDGTGTTNYVAKWSDTDTITNSVIYDNGTNVGIGTTDPNNKIHVAGSIYSTEYTNPVDGQTPAIQIGYDSSADIGILNTWSSKPLRIEAYNDVTIRTTGSDRLIVKGTSGNVGIGTTSPSAKLEVGGNIAASDQISVNNRTAISVAHWAGLNTTTGAIKISLPGSHGGNWSMIVLRITTYEYNSNNHTVYYVSGHDWVSGWYNGGVTKIGDSDKNISLAYDSNKDYVIVGETTSSWSYGHVTVDVMAHPSFYSGSMDIRSGWGISQDADLTGITIQAVNNRKVLTSADAYYTESESDDRFVNVTGDTMTGDLTLNSNFYLNPSSTQVTMSGNTSGNFTIDNNTGQIAFQANGSTVNSMTITSSQITLNEISQVNNTLRTLTAMGDTNQWNSAALRLETTNTIDTTGFQGLRFATSTADNYGWRVGANRRGNGRGSLRFYEHANSIAGVERFTIAEDGNVGIGTSSPGYKLSVNGDIQIPQNEYIYFDNTAHYIRRGSSNVELQGYNGLELRTENSTRLLINQAGNVGIGTTSPSAKLDIYGDSNSADNMIELINSKYDSTDTAGETGILFGWNNHVAARITAFKEGTVNRTGFKIIGEAGFNVPTTIATFRSTGDVGIGTTSPSHKLQVVGDGAFNSTLVVQDPAVSSYGSLSLYHDSTGSSIHSNPASSNGSTVVLRLGINNSEKMRIANNGNVGIGTTTPGARLEVVAEVGGNKIGAQFRPATSGSNYGARTIYVHNTPYGQGAVFHRAGTYDNVACSFQYQGSQKGSITIQPTSTSYNTTSDYRLKENLIPITDSIDRVKQLKPKRFNFIGDNATVDGFIAHEAQEVVPESVTGEKDAVLPNGEADYQGIDQSKLVPLLTAALQDAITKIEQLETRIQTLENND